MALQALFSKTEKKKYKLEMSFKTQAFMNYNLK